MTTYTQYDEAVRLVFEGQLTVEKIQEAAPEDRDPYGKQARGIWAQAQVHATLALVEELRRLNDGRDAFHREVLEVLTQAKAEPKLRCEVCGKQGDIKKCVIGPLTREQWKTHYATLYQQRMANGSYPGEASRYARTKMDDDFGPCPPEGPSGAGATAQVVEKEGP